MIVSSGTVIIGASCLLLFLLFHLTRADIMILLGMIGVGLDSFFAPYINSVMGSVRREDSGLASGSLGTMRLTGQMTSIVVATMVLSLYMPRSLTIEMFSGSIVTIMPLFYDSFINGFRIVMLISSVLAFIGTVAFLMKNRGR